MLKVLYPCKICTNDVANVNKSGPHNKLICSKCGAYIKFIGQLELDNLDDVSEIDTSIDINNTNIINLNEINFKLDLVLNHLKILKE